MRIQVVGCSHHDTAIEVREKLAFSPAQTREALDRWRRVFPRTEAVLLSTCNRVEIYTAGEADVEPSLEQAAMFLAEFHGLDAGSIIQYLYLHHDEAAVRHLFTVASSLDSMVVGEPQILGQVKEAYQTAMLQESTGPLLHAAFQAALRVARRVASETAVHQRRVSIPSVAVADFGRQIFERFDDKHVVVIGAGEMAAETLRYLREEGAHQITVVNRSYQRASELAPLWHGRAIAWDQLLEALATADLIISTTGANEPIVRMAEFGRIERRDSAGRFLSLIWAYPAISSRPLASGRTFTCIPSTICRRPAGETKPGATRNYPMPCGSSTRKPRRS